MLHILRWATVFLAFLATSALPVASDTLFEDLEIRAPELQISLRESHSGDPGRWHFSLVVHKSGDSTGSNLPTHEVIIDQKNTCMAYWGARPGGKSNPENRIFPTANLIPQGEPTDAKLKDKVTEIFRGLTPKKAKGFPIASGGFVNCLDWTMMAMQALRGAGYVSETDLAKFTTVFAEKNEELRKVTDPSTLEVCGLSSRALNGKPSPACQRKKASKAKSKPIAVPRLPKASALRKPVRNLNPQPRAGVRAPQGRGVARKG